MVVNDPFVGFVAGGGGAPLDFHDSKQSKFCLESNGEMSVFSTHDLESSNWNKIQKLVLHQKRMAKWLPWVPCSKVLAQQQLHRRRQTYFHPWRNYPIWQKVFKWVETTTQSIFPCLMSNVPCHLFGGLSIHVNYVQPNIITVPPARCLTFILRNFGELIPNLRSRCFCQRGGQKPTR